MLTNSAVLSAVELDINGPTTSPPPSPSLSLLPFVQNVTVTELNTYANFSVRLSFPSTNIVSVQFATFDGTAQAGADYWPRTANSFFSSGETKTIAIAIPPRSPLMKRPKRSSLALQSSMPSSTVQWSPAASSTMTRLQPCSWQRERAGRELWFHPGASTRAFSRRAASVPGQFRHRQHRRAVSDYVAPTAHLVFPPGRH
jgi:hypothetical protein